MHTFIGWCAKLYEHNDYNGWEQIVHDTSYGTPSHNDAVTSIKVQSRDKCTFKAYKHINKGDLLETLTSDNSLLNDNDDLSSFSCSCTRKFTIQIKNHLKSTSYFLKDFCSHFSYHTNNFFIFNSKELPKSSLYVTQAIYGVNGDYIKFSCVDLVTGNLGRYSALSNRCTGFFFEKFQKK